MSELLFVGLGLFDEKDLTVRALEELARCEILFAEEYTSRWGEGALRRLSDRLGRPVELLDREHAEEGGKVLTALEGHARVALLVVGEPFAATTHVSLRLSVEEKGHAWRVLHNASILTAAASLAGLSHYRFGRTVSLPRPVPGFRPTSPYDLLLANWRAELHTLVLLDLDPKAGVFLLAGEALQLLAEMEREKKGELFLPDRRVVVVARAGSPTASVHVGRMADLRGKDFGPPLHCLIVPGPSLHFVEEEALRRLAPPSSSAPQAPGG